MRITKAQSAHLKELRDNISTEWNSLGKNGNIHSFVGMKLNSIGLEYEKNRQIIQNESEILQNKMNANIEAKEAKKPLPFGGDLNGEGLLLVQDSFCSKVTMDSQIAKLQELVKEEKKAITLGDWFCHPFDTFHKNSALNHELEVIAETMDKLNIFQENLDTFNKAFKDGKTPEGFESDERQMGDIFEVKAKEPAEEELLGPDGEEMEFSESVISKGLNVFMHEADAKIDGIEPFELNDEDDPLNTSFIEEPEM